jgi:acyl-CoA reductase-like NAD-dependent aldehyde dehydrogenase
MMRACIPPGSQPAGPPLAAEREAQAKWAGLPVARRLQFVRNLRHLVARHAEVLAAAAAEVSSRPVAEKLVSEVLPLADACRWLERRATHVLAARRHGRRDRPLWMQGASFEVQRQPFGIVLVIGPGNYPLFLPAVHALHALVAGNAVLLKPAPGTGGVATLFARLARLAGLESLLLTILPDGVAAGRRAMARGVDKVIFTGSSENGRDVLSELAQSNTPAVMELSGEDAVMVLADADIALVVRALSFGTRLNGGDTCIAPRRVVAVESVAADLRAHMSRAGVSEMPVEDVPSEEAAVRRVSAARFGLGVSIFSRDVARARALAARLPSGFVLVNDLIVPTADPRMPFGGVKASGFGVTRGEEGLLEMTSAHVVAVRHGTSRPHFDEPRAGDEQIFSSYILAAHGRGRQRLGAVRDLVGAVLERTRNRSRNP